MVYCVELKGDLGWSKFNFHKESWSSQKVPDTMKRISSLEVDNDTFIEQYERPNLPAVITNCQEAWDANRKWTIEVIMKHHGHVTVM